MLDQNVDAEVMDEVFEVEVSAVLDAEHDAFVPPLVPAHDHVHGPLPDTVLAVPAVQRLLVGALATVVPLAEPQVPLIVVDVDPSIVPRNPFGHPIAASVNPPARTCDWSDASADASNPKLARLPVNAAGELAVVRAYPSPSTKYK